MNQKLPPRDEFLDLVVAAIREEKSADDLQIAPDRPFRLYGLDSLDLMNVLVSLEERLDVTLTDVAIREDDTVNSLHDRLSQQLSAGS